MSGPVYPYRDRRLDHLAASLEEAVILAAMRDVFATPPRNVVLQGRIGIRQIKSEPNLIRRTRGRMPHAR